MSYEARAIFIHIVQLLTQINTHKTFLCLLRVFIRHRESEKGRENSICPFPTVHNDASKHTVAETKATLLFYFQFFFQFRLILCNNFFSLYRLRFFSWCPMTKILLFSLLHRYSPVAHMCDGKTSAHLTLRASKITSMHSLLCMLFVRFVFFTSYVCKRPFGYFSKRRWNKQQRKKNVGMSLTWFRQLYNKSKNLAIAID